MAAGDYNSSRWWSVAMPLVTVLAGINGAGKTTASDRLLRDDGRTGVFVNADAIARGLNSLNPESVALEAGQFMLQQMKKLAAAKVDFSFETTLAGRTYYAWLRSLKADLGYEVRLFYYWLRSPELAIERVAARVRAGGHNIPEATIRKRFHRSIGNFLNLYRPLLDHWEVYDNSNGERIVIATGSPHEFVADSDSVWSRFERSATQDG